MTKEEKNRIIDALINCETVFQFKEGLKLYLNKDIRNKKELPEVIELITNIKEDRHCIYAAYISSHEWVINSKDYLELVKLMAKARDGVHAWYIEQSIINYDIVNMDKQLECAKLVYNTKYNKRARYIEETLTDKRLIYIDKNIEVATILNKTKEIFLDNTYKVSSDKQVINSGDVVMLTKMASAGFDPKDIYNIIPITNDSNIKKLIK